jgi:hypothetical protein
MSGGVYLFESEQRVISAHIIEHDEHPTTALEAEGFRFRRIELADLAEIDFDTLPLHVCTRAGGCAGQIDADGFRLAAARSITEVEA